MAYPGGFSLVGDPSDTHIWSLPISSITVVRGDVLELTAGSTTWALCTSTSDNWTLKAVAQEAASTSATVVKAILVDSNQFWVAETANDSATADNGDTMILTDANTVNNTGTNNTTVDAVFLQLAPSGAAADKRIIGKFF